MTSEKEFSSGKHVRGEWDTRVSHSRNPLVRGVWNWVSYKRAMVDALGRMAGANDLVLDLGCGKTAYSQWLIGRTPCTIVAVDVAFEALAAAPRPPHGAILRVQADAQRLPFRHEVFDAVFSVDALGHLPRPQQALDEVLRTLKPGGAALLHSECSDHLKRWPDRKLIGKLGADVMAQHDGHVSLRPSSAIHDDYARRFIIRGFFSPPGYAGWLLGYPEKYAPAFKKAGWTFLWMLASYMAWIKKLPILGWKLRLLNAITNHMELYFSLHGGGSCFAILEKPGPADVIRTPKPFFDVMGT